MRYFVNLAGLAFFSSAALAAPAPASLENRAASCTFSGSNGAALASKSKTSCSTIVLSSVAVPAGTTLDLTGLNTGTHVIFEGITTFGYEQWTGPLISISGTDITVEGASGAVLDGSGKQWWDGKGSNISNGGKIKPKFFFAHNLKSSSISNLKIVNSPVQVFSIDSSDTLTLDHITIDNSAGDTEGAHNTGAFDVGDSNGITISNAIVYNQDDCLAVNSGTNIIFTGGTCSGGHGLSIGSVGGRSNNDVNTVHIEDSIIQNSQNGVRIKTVSKAQGSVAGVIYKNITLSGITDYGIIIEQDYENGHPTGIPTNGVPITGLTIDGVQGSVSSSATEVYILCGDGSCSNWTWEGVDITGGKKTNSCKNVPTGASC